MSDLDLQARLRVSALLQRIMHGAEDRFSAADAAALWRELDGARAPRLGQLAAGRWRLRRYRRWFHAIVEVESGDPARPARLRYTLFGAPRDLLRLRGRVLDLPVWPGVAYAVVLGAFRPWKQAAA